MIGSKAYKQLARNAQCQLRATEGQTNTLVAPDHNGKQELSHSINAVAADRQMRSDQNVARLTHEEAKTKNAVSQRICFLHAYVCHRVYS